MARIQAVRRVQFAAGHRVLGHEGKCAHLHGHNYVVFFYAEADALDGVGRVIDFSILKERLGGWIDQHWDHGFIYFDQDEDLSRVFSEHLPGHKHFPMPRNPTAENMAQYLLETVGPEQLGGTGVHLSKVVIWETENCFAETSM